MKLAVIGIGSNSVRMLVANVGDGRIDRIRRDRAGTRLFAGLDERRNLSAEAMASSCQAVRAMADSARSEGCEEVRLFATSATRDAANQADFSRMLRNETGLTLEICTGDEEAALSFFGATDGGDSGVLDIGGGSTELIVGNGMDIRCAFSCQMGAVRLHKRIPIREQSDLAPVIAIAKDILAEQLRRHPTLTLPKAWRGTGGTFTTLAAISRGVRWTDRTYMHGAKLTRMEVQRIAGMLSDMPLEERMQLPGLQPHRADIVVHGICILLACMEQLGFDELTVSEYGNLDGYIKDRFL